MAGVSSIILAFKNMPLQILKVVHFGKHSNCHLPEAFEKPKSHTSSLIIYSTVSQHYRTPVADEM
jgi:hypothetical protein